MGRLKNIRFLSTILALVMMISLLPTNIVKAAGLVEITPDLNGSTESNPVVLTGLRPEITIELEADTEIYPLTIKKLPGTSDIADEFEISSDDVTNITIIPKNDLVEDETYYINLSTKTNGYTEHKFYFKPSLESNDVVEPDVVAPTVDSVEPIDDTVDVAVDSNVTVTFSEAMDSTTTTGSSIKLMKDTESVIPKVVSTNPTDGQSGVAVDTNITVTFSEAMDSTTTTGSSIKLLKGTDEVVAVVDYNDSTNTATVDPSDDLDNETTYTIKVTTDVTDVAGNPLENEHISSFTTEAFDGISVGEKPEIESIIGFDSEGNQTVITSGMSDAPLRFEKIEILFNQKMNETTILDGEGFTAKFSISIRTLSEDAGLNMIDGAVETIGEKTKAIITGGFGGLFPLEFSPEVEYAIVIPSAVTNIDGVGISDSETLIKFTTGKSTIVKNTLLDVFVDNTSIMNGTSIVTPVEVNISDDSQITAFFNNELSDVNLEDTGLVRIWEQNETAYGKVIYLPESAYSIEGNKYLIDISNELLDTDKVYKIIFDDYIVDINNQFLDKRYELFFKPVIKAISPDGMITIEGDNIIKTGEESTLTVKSDLESFAKLSFELEYDIKELSVTTVELSDELAGLNALVEIVKENDKDIGLIRFTADLDEDMMISNLFDITFKSLNGEVTQLSINDINCSNKAHMPINVGSQILKISGFTYDLNLDNKVNILDVIMVTRTIGLTSESEEWSLYSSRDINEDGKITEADAEIIKSKMTSNN